MFGFSRTRSANALTMLRYSEIPNDFSTENLQFAEVWIIEII